MSDTTKPTIWIFGDQLNQNIASLEGRSPEDCRVLLVESQQKILSKPWHAQRQHLIVSAMSHFAEELRAEGYEVDYRHAASMRAGLEIHREETSVTEVVAMEPNSWTASQLLDELGVQRVPTHFHKLKLCWSLRESRRPITILRR